MIVNKIELRVTAWIILLGWLAYGKAPKFDPRLLKNKKNIVPVAVLGSGPTGESSGLYLSRAGIPTFVFEGEKPGGQIVDTKKIENWPGVPPMSGRAAMDLLHKQTKTFGAHHIPKTITQVDFSSWPFILHTQDGDTIHALSVIIATGALPRRLGVQGEKVYWGKGVLACALCDAPLSKGQQAVVIGDDDIAIERVLQLAPYASAIELLVPGDQMYASHYMQKKLTELPQLHISYNTRVKKILGNGKRVTEIILRNTQTKKETLFKTQWVYLSVGFEPNNDLFKNKLKLTKGGHIKVDCETQKTSIPGIYAAGAVATDVLHNQVGIVTAQGIKAALNCIDFLRKLGVDSKHKKLIESELYAPVILEDADQKKLYVNSVKEFEEKVLARKNPVLVYFFDPACAHCNKTKPTIIELAAKLPDTIYLLDTTTLSDIARAHKISSVPAYIIFKNGKEIARSSGPQSKKKIEKFLEKHK